MEAQGITAEGCSRDKARPLIVGSEAVMYLTKKGAEHREVMLYGEPNCLTH